MAWPGSYLRIQSFAVDKKYFAANGDASKHLANCLTDGYCSDARRSAITRADHAHAVPPGLQ